MNSSKSDVVTISQRGMELVIERRWFVKGQTIHDTVFAIVWNGFLGFMFYQSPSLFFSQIDGGLSLVAAVPTFVLGGAGLFLAYRAVTQWLNRTVIVVNRTTISVRHSGLPWPGNKVISAVGINRLQVVLSRVSRGSRRNRRDTYNLVAETADGQRTKLAGGFTGSDADNIKLAIEKYLSIEPAKPTPPDAAELDRQAIDNFYAGRPLDQTPADAAARHKAAEEATTLQGVIGIWTFILVWNGFIWWVIWGLVSRAGATVPWLALAIISLFVLVGLGLIYLVMPSTIQFFRQKGTPNQVAVQNKGGWGVFVSLAVIGIGSVFILKQLDSRRNAAATDAPYSRDDHFQALRGDVMESLNYHAGPPQPITFFEGAWRLHGVDMGRGDFTRVVVRPEGDGHRIRAWHRCDLEGQTALGVCDAGEVPAVFTPRADGQVDHVSAEWVTPSDRKWLRLSSGKYAQQPAVIGSLAMGSFGASPRYIDGRVFTFRENPAAPIEAFVGDWANDAARQVETWPQADFTRLTIRQTGPQRLGVRLWAVCVDGTECDRGEVPAQIEWENGMVREIKARYSGEQAKFWSLSIILPPPHQGRFNAVTVRAGSKNTVGKAKLAALTSGHR